MKYTSFINNLKEKQKLESAKITKILMSSQFLILYIVTLLKCSSNFFYSDYFKEFGMYFIKDDIYLGLMVMIGVVFNFLSRVSMGKIYNLFGLKMCYFLNIILEIFCALFLLFGATNKVFFGLFMMTNRVSSGSFSLFEI